MAFCSVLFKKEIVQKIVTEREIILKYYVRHITIIPNFDFAVILYYTYAVLP